MPRILRISTSFATVLAAYWVYALTVVPRIEPPPVRRATDSSPAAPLTPIDRLIGFRELFRPDDWEVGPKTVVLESEQVKFLVPDREYANEPGSPTVGFEKCTIIFTPHGASANETERTRQAILLQAEKGAVLEFDQPFDLRRGSIGRLKSARLNGRIVIRGEGKSPGPEDDLRAVTSDIQVTEQRVWAPNPIEFSLGRSTGRGSEMQIKFVPGDILGGGASHGLNIGGIESVEVRRLERLHLEPFSKQTRGGQPAAAGPAQRAWNLPIEVVCRGPFRFDLGQQLATFEDRVDLLRIHPDGPSDQVNCDVLAIQFGRRREAARPPGAPPDATPGALGGLPDLEVRFVEARGSPVVVRAPGQHVDARGEELKYDLQDNKIVLKGPHEVSMKQAANEIHARWIEYTLSETGGLGEASAKGPGWLRGQMGDKLAQPLEARWKGRLRVRPDEHRQQVISLIDDAEMNYGALGKLEAAEIHFWLNETPREVAPAAPSAQRFSVQPDRMLARNHVRLHAAQLSGAVNQLEVWFESPPTVAPTHSSPPPRGTSPQASAGKGNGHVAQEAPAAFAGRPRPHPAMQMARQFPRVARTAWRMATDDSPLTGLLAAQAGAGVYAGFPSPANSSAGATLGRQFQIDGTLLRARVAGLGERAEISELIVEGNVRLVETQTAQAGEKPLAVAGDRIHVVNAGKPHAAVGVTGHPARFEGRGLTLEGSNINLNAGTNRLWIDGPGKVEILMDRDLQGRPIGGVASETRRLGLRPDLQEHPIATVGSEPQPTGPLVIQWQDRMALDGRTVRFDESVVATANQQQLRTETLEVGFREPIRFSDPKQASRPEIEAMVCRGRVILEASEADAAGQTSVERVDVLDLMINRTSGAVRASGPGRVVAVRRQSHQTPPVIPSGPARPPQTSEVSQTSESLGTDAKPLVYLDVRFQRELTGNLLHRQMVFHEQVRCTYVPVDSWDARFDDDSPESLGPHGMTLRCDRLAATQLPVPGSSQRAWGLEASGNTLAEGQAFTAQATRITYDQAKGLLVLEGDGRTDAALHLQQQPNQRRTSQQSRRILFWPATKQFILDGFRSLEIPNLPGGQRKEGGPAAAPR